MTAALIMEAPICPTIPIPPAMAPAIAPRVLSRMQQQFGRDSAAVLADFHARVYDVALSIRPGETLTYGEVARRIGEPGAAQAVGQALGKNPWPIIVPCHRVLAAGGRTGGFSANGGIDTKLRLLTIERARTAGAPTLFDDDPAFGLAARPGTGRR